MTEQLDFHLLEKAVTLSFALLKEAGFDAPPIIPYSVAARRDIRVRELPLPSEETARLTREPEPLIELNSLHPPERRCFSLSYQLMRLLLPADGLTATQAHSLYIAGATELMMPAVWVRELGELVDWNLFELRHEFSYSSFESMARRMVDLTPAALAILDNGELSCRLASPGMSVPPGLTTLERTCLQRSQENGPGLTEEQTTKQRCRAYFLHPKRSGWKRILLLTTPRSPV